MIPAPRPCGSTADPVFASKVPAGLRSKGPGVASDRACGWWQSDGTNLRDGGGRGRSTTGRRSGGRPAGQMVKTSRPHGHPGVGGVRRCGGSPLASTTSPCRPMPASVQVTAGSVQLPAARLATVPLSTPPDSATAVFMRSLTERAPCADDSHVLQSSIMTVTPEWLVGSAVGQDLRSADQAVHSRCG